jgi:protoheme IX farnesyltransferase
MTSLVLESRPFRTVTRDYMELSKSRIVMMVLITTMSGYLVGAKTVDPLVLLNVLIGTALLAAGTNALNQYIEREHDAKMARTSRRPLPSGRITPRAALLFSTGIAILGALYLGLAVNWLTAGLGAFTLTSYIFVYTPLKRISTICTIIGAVPGAIPPLMGWTAATNELSLGGWFVFGILFFWQLPHFMALSWMFREDYARGGYMMHSVFDERGTGVARQAIYYSLALIAVSVGPSLIGITGPFYFVTASLSGLALLYTAFRFFFDRSMRSARTLFMASNIYLLVVMLFLVLDARL